jgi:hypothetical protein
MASRLLGRAGMRPHINGEDEDDSMMVDHFPWPWQHTSAGRQE